MAGPTTAQDDWNQKLAEDRQDEQTASAPTAMLVLPLGDTDVVVTRYGARGQEQYSVQLGDKVSPRVDTRQLREFTRLLAAMLNMRTEEVTGA